MQTKIEPEFVLFFDCPEEEMERRILSRNQVRIYDSPLLKILFIYFILVSIIYLPF